MAETLERLSNSASAVAPPDAAATDAAGVVEPESPDIGASRDAPLDEHPVSTSELSVTPPASNSRRSALPSRLAGLRKRFPGRPTISLYLATMGPGLIAALAGNDAGGIGTYSLAGAQYGYQLLFVLLVITFLLGLVQEMAARMGAVTQKGLGELIREQYGVGWTLFALGVMFIANFATTIAEFAGIAAGGELFGISKWISVPLAAVMMWLLISRGPFRLVERIFLAICLVQVTYIIAAFKAVGQRPSGQGWDHVLKQLIVPHFSTNASFLLLCVGVIGTTVTPYMQFFLQSNIADKGVRISEYRYQKADVYAGVIVTNAVAFFIMVCTAATLWVSHTPVNSTSDVARALSQPLGSIGTTLFAVGLLAASLMAAAILPLSTAYTYCEAFGWEIGIGRGFKRAPFFYGMFTGVLGLSALVVLLLPSKTELVAMVVSQEVNGILLPVVLIFMLQLVNTRRIMGDYVNGRWSNILAWGSVVFLIALTLVLLVASVLGWG